MNRRTAQAFGPASTSTLLCVALLVGCQSGDGVVRQPEPGGLMTRNGPGEPGSLSRALLQDQERPADDLRLLEGPTGADAEPEVDPNVGAEAEGVSIAPADRTQPQAPADADRPIFIEQDLPADPVEGAEAGVNGFNPASARVEDAGTGVDPEVDAMISGTRNRSVITGDDTTPAAGGARLAEDAAPPAVVTSEGIIDPEADTPGEQGPQPAHTAFDEKVSGLFGASFNEDAASAGAGAMESAAPKSEVAEVVESGDDRLPLSPLLKSTEELTGSLDRSSWPRLVFSPADSGVEQINQAWFVSDIAADPRDVSLPAGTAGETPVLRQMDQALGTGN